MGWCVQGTGYQWVPVCTSGYQWVPVYQVYQDQISGATYISDVVFFFIEQVVQFQFRYFIGINAVDDSRAVLESHI